MTDVKKPRLGISSCLMGHLVRYDGQHKHDVFLTDTLGRFVEYVPVCPEVECGMPVPREAMRLVGEVESPRLVTINTGRDLTGQMRDWVKMRVDELESENLCGFIFKAKSPSSGMERVKIYNEKGGVRGMGAGLFAAAFMKRYPLLPVEDEGRLHDPELRENFIERVFALWRYRDTVRTGAMREIVEFHSRHKMLIMAHSEKHCRELGRLVAGGGRGKKFAAMYEETLLDALKKMPTRARHVNVMQHIMGFFKTKITSDEKQELLGLIADYRRGNIPLIVPLTMLAHYVRKYNVEWMRQQYYLYPHPLELQLRNHS